MSSQPPRIQLQVRLGPDDYARYYAVMGKRQSTWGDFLIYAGAFFTALPVSIAVEALASRETDSRFVAELAGRFSMFAFFAGLFAFGLALWIVRRRAIGATLSTVPNAFDSKTIVLDEHDISITGKLSQARWTWPAITHVSAEKNLVLFWIGSQNAVIIPDRAFANVEARDDAIAFSRARIAGLSPAPDSP